jgi:threonine 3-dehydrogenase
MAEGTARSETAHKTLVIGGAGAIGKRLIARLVARDGPGSVVAGLRNTPLPAALASEVVCEFGVDVRKVSTLRALLTKHAATVRWVWNLAAPLSVDTAADPAVAQDVTVGGMERLLRVMAEVGLSRLCFSDSIGSFGASAPRDEAPASWLVERPTQDPGSDYGRQKRGCRELMQCYSGGRQQPSLSPPHSPTHYHTTMSSCHAAVSVPTVRAEKRGFDTRWAVIPGVLHADATWGGGTTEYALDAILCAARGDATFACPVPLDTPLPMIMVDDLVTGMLALMDAPRAALTQPQAGYALAGFSFSARQLFEVLRRQSTDDGATAAGGRGGGGGGAQAEGGGPAVSEVLEPSAAAFAELWPDSISAAEARADLVCARATDRTCPYLTPAVPHPRDHWLAACLPG